MKAMPTLDDMTARLCEQTWRWLDGETGPVLLWLQQLGCRIVARPEPGQVWVLDGIAGGRATLVRDPDPIAVASAIGFLCGGMLWPHAFPQLLAQVNAEWRRRPTRASTPRADDRQGERTSTTPP